MTSYLNLTTRLEEINSNLENDYSNINSLLESLKGSFNGESATKLCNDLSTSLEQLKSQITLVNSLTKVLPLLDDHSTNVKTLNDYKSKKNNWTSDNPEDTNPYSRTVSSYESKVSTIETQITNQMPTISSVTSSITLINPTIDFSYKNYTHDASAILSLVKSGLNVSYGSAYQTLIDKAIGSWIDGFKNNSYNLRTGVLSTYYTADEIDSLIETESIGATPREKAVIAALTIIELGIDNNMKSQYKLSTKCFNSVSRPYDTKTLINNGADCASYVSWALNTSSSSNFNNATLETIRRQGTKTSYENLQPGDIIYNSGHVAMVINNQISNNSGYIIVADASSYDTGGYPKGIRLQRISYKTLSSMFTGYDLTEFYERNA